MAKNLIGQMSSWSNGDECAQWLRSSKAHLSSININWLDVGPTNVYVQFILQINGRNCCFFGGRRKGRPQICRGRFVFQCWLSPWPILHPLRIIPQWHFWHVLLSFGTIQRPIFHSFPSAKTHQKDGQLLIGPAQGNFHWPIRSLFGLWWLAILSTSHFNFLF